MDERIVQLAEKLLVASVAKSGLGGDDERSDAIEQAYAMAQMFYILTDAGTTGVIDAMKTGLPPVLWDADKRRRLGRGRRREGP